MASPLFELRGKLDRKQSLILEVAGVLLLLIFWAIGAQMISKERVTQIDHPEATMVDSSYYLNDSLLIAEEADLKKLGETELAEFGLKKEVKYLLPSPLQVLRSFKPLHQDDDLIKNSNQSIWLNILGYLLAIGIAIPLGFLLGLIPLFRGLFSRIFDAFRFIPLTAVTGIFILWLGLESTMKVSFLAFGIMVYLIPVVVQRVDEVRTVYLRTVFTLGANNWQTIKSVYFPSVISRLIDDIRVLTAISWTYITIAEMLNRSGGIGELIWLARRQSRLDKAFAVLIVIIIIGILQDVYFRYLDKRLFPFKYGGDGKVESSIASSIFRFAGLVIGIILLLLSILPSSRAVMFEIMGYGLHVLLLLTAVEGLVYLATRENKKFANYAVWALAGIFGIYLISLFIPGNDFIQRTAPWYIPHAIFLIIGAYFLLGRTKKA